MVVCSVVYQLVTMGK